MEFLVKARDREADDLDHERQKVKERDVGHLFIF